MSNAEASAQPRGATLCTIAHKWAVTKAQATKEAKRLERKHGQKMNVWKCQCGGWHIGKRKPRPKPY